MTSAEASPHLSEHWEHDEARRTAVHRALIREVAPTHELAGRIVQVTACFKASDDVVVELVDGTFALVHPTWSTGQEIPPWPMASVLGDAAAASDALARWETEWELDE